MNERWDMKKKIIFIWLSLLIITVPAALAEKLPKLTEESASDLRKLKHSVVSEVNGLFHPSLEEYARLAEIDLKQVLGALKLSSIRKGKVPAFIGPNSRYK